MHTFCSLGMDKLYQTMNCLSIGYVDSERTSMRRVFASVVAGERASGVSRERELEVLGRGRGTLSADGRTSVYGDTLSAS